MENLAKKGEKTQVALNITERLPAHISPPCLVSLTFSLQKQDDYFLLALKTEASLNIICQRCAETFQIPYQNETELAICDNEVRAESLLPFYECMVSGKDELELEAIIADELHLYSPQFHPDTENCDKIVQQYISG